MTHIFEAHNHILIQSGYADPKKHRHMAAHIIVSMDGEMEIEAGGSEYRSHGIMIPSGVSHTVDTLDSSVLVFLYDCTTDVARQITDIQSIPKDICNLITSMYRVFLQKPTAEGYREFENSFLSQLGISNMVLHEKDERILWAMAYIRSNLSEKITCRDAASASALSQGRFSHLFRQQVGMTFSAYLIYQRTLYVYAEILQGKSITEAALEAGFSGSSHFADVNRRIFGISASSITGNMQFTKIQ